MYGYRIMYKAILVAPVKLSGVQQRKVKNRTPRVVRLAFDLHFQVHLPAGPGLGVALDEDKVTHYSRDRVKPVRVTATNG